MLEAGGGGGNAYAGWSLSALKAAAASVEVGTLQHASTTYGAGAQTLGTVSEAFAGAVNGLAAGWQGKAAQAAIGKAGENYQTMVTTQQLADQSRSTTDSYRTTLVQQKTQVAQIPDVDTSFGHAMSQSGGNPLTALVKMYENQQQYDQNQSQAAGLVDQMDSAGRVQQAEMQSNAWPPPSGPVTPPAPLPPPPARFVGGTGGGLSGSQPGYTGPRGGTTTPPAPVFGGGHNDGPTQTQTGQGTHGPGTTSPVSGGSTPPAGTGTGVTVPQGGDGGTMAVGGSGGGTTEAVPVVSTPGGAGAAAAALGGAGLLAAGGLGARAGFAGSGSLLAPGAGGGAGGPGDGVAGEGRLGAGVRGGSVVGGADDAVATRAGGIARTTGGFAGEPTAAEAGRIGGGYPIGGGARRRADDEEEAPVPDYLVETEDVWGDGAVAAPPVIGE